MDLKAIQKALRQRKIGGWLFVDFHFRDHLAYRVLKLEPGKMCTRRWFYFIPARGIPRKLVHGVESGKLDSLPGSKRVYSSWEQLHTSLRKILGPKKVIAMQYSPKNNIPAVSIVDGGMLELVRACGHRVVSSADLVLKFEALIGEEGYRLHMRAGGYVHRIRRQAFDQIRKAIATGKKTTEYDIQQFIMRRFKQNGLTTSDPPIVGTNDHPVNPHFEPSSSDTRVFKAGDTVLIDLWAKMNLPGAIYHDITWVGYIGQRPPKAYLQIFDAVRRGRDAAIQYVGDKFAQGKPCYGWQVDRVCRTVIEKAGYGKYFIHRTGHSIGEEVHGNGVNIDNLETKDDRQLIPGCCFSIEPGIYLPGRMAARTEVNVFIRDDGAVEVTGEKQEEIVKI